MKTAKESPAIYYAQNTKTKLWFNGENFSNKTRILSKGLTFEQACLVKHVWDNVQFMSAWGPTYTCSRESIDPNLVILNRK